VPGFIRRYGFFPGNEVITQIEGVVIVDLPPPGAIEGVDVGVACLVGEFSDMTYAVDVDGTGAVSVLIQPQEVFSGQDFLNKFGGWDPTIGDIGDSGGNGFISLRSKKYSRLIIAPINLASDYGFRFFRELPLCTTTTDPLPVVPVQGGVIEAGREFRSGSGGRVLVAKRVLFTALDTIATGVGGSITNAAGDAATQDFTVAGENFFTMARPDGGSGIKKGDIVVIGNNNAGARQPLPASGDEGAATYRVAVDALVGTPTVLELEMLSGEDFDFVTAATIPWRIHVSSDADSAPVVVLGATVPGGYAAPDAGGYSVPVRPLTQFDGSSGDGVWTIDSPLTPLVTPPALTGSSADPLSSLGGQTHITQTAAYTAAVQAENVVSSAAVDALYTTALAATISDLNPVSDINIIWCSRTSSTIRAGIKSNVLAASAVSKGRVGVIRPELDVVTTSAAVADADPGVGGNRDERIDYTWPGAVISVPEAVNTRLKTADGLTTIDGLLDVGFDSFVTSILSNLPPERNPGQAAAPVPELLAAVVGMQRGITKLEMNDYIALKNRGVMALRMDRRVGPIIQSGVTSSLTSGEKNANRRRFADFIQDSAADRLVNFAKLPLTDANKDNQVTELTAFAEELLSQRNPAAARIQSYSVDDKSGNTPESLAANIFVIIVKIRMIPTGDFIVLQTEVGNNVVTATAT
jgi:hypothetical protein